MNIALGVALNIALKEANLGACRFLSFEKSAITASGYLVIGLASILVGEAIFGKRSFKNWLISVALGSIVYFIIVTIATRLGLPTELKSLLYAILITLALCIQLIKDFITKQKNKRLNTKGD